MLMGKKVSGQCDGTENKQDTGSLFMQGNNSKLMMALMTIFVYLCMKDDIVLVNIAFSGTTYYFTGYFTRPSWQQLTLVRTLVKMLKGKNFVLTGVVIIIRDHLSDVTGSGS